MLSLKTKEIAVISAAWNQQVTGCFGVLCPGDETAGLE